MADVNPRGVFFAAAALMSSMTLIALWRIKEPPVFHPATSGFNFLAPIRIACRDKRILVLIVAVALLHAFPMIFKTWVWFYAKNKLGLTVGDTGVAMSWGLLLQVAFSYPAGWLIDRFGSYLALCIQWVIMLILVLSCDSCHQLSRPDPSDVVVFSLPAFGGCRRHHSVEDHGQG